MYKQAIKSQEMDISLNYYFYLTQNNCYYCDSKPRQRGENYPSSIYFANGVDRVDNSIGYTKSNCVTACTNCNLMKTSSSQHSFFQHVKRIYDYNFNGMDDLVDYE